MEYKILEIKWKYPNYFNIKGNDVWKYLENNKKYEQIKLLNFRDNALRIILFNPFEGLKEELNDKFKIDFNVKRI